MTTHHDDFAHQVYAIIAVIPEGRVTTYGAVARLAGVPTYVRQVCAVLRNVPSDSILPCHRIINGQGRISVSGESYARHKATLLAEGIIFDEKDRIDFKVFGWNYPYSTIKKYSGKSES